MRTKRPFVLMMLAAAAVFAGASYAAEWKTLSGEVVAFDPEKSEIIVNTEVLGLRGPELKEVAYKLDGSTIFTVCIGLGLDECNSAVGSGGWDLIERFERITPFAVLDKDATLVRNMQGMVTHVEIVYHQ